MLDAAKQTVATGLGMMDVSLEELVARGGRQVLRSELIAVSNDARR
jgi:hypothetical protein